MHLAILVSVLAACQAELPPPTPVKPATPKEPIGPSPIAPTEDEPPKPATGPCVVGTRPTLRMAGGDPVVCGEDGRCLRLDAHGLAPVDMPPVAPVLALAADVRVVNGKWSACRDARCKPVGRQLATALAHSAAQPAPVDSNNQPVVTRTATLDLRAVVVDDALWDVAADRAVTLAKPEVKPWGPERELTVAGDVVLVQWFGDCTDMLCMTSREVDRRGRELAWVVRSSARAHDLMRIDNDHYLVIADLDGVAMYELHTGKPLGKFEPPMNENALAVAALDGTHYSVLRTRHEEGFVVTVIDVAGGHLTSTGRETTLHACEP